jgi:hypothetical protein
MIRQFAHDREPALGEILTKGGSIKILAESVLTFKL